ncbi:hypothetical protein SESBI_44715 [Sesbania bispinosa]|nr:hypothetical protein SESBI_44715 [Sesbania bispinosa]
MNEDSEDNDTVVMDTFAEGPMTDLEAEGGLSKERKVVSYKDICLGEDKDASDEDTSESEEDDQEMEEDKDSSDEETAIVKISKEERKEACKPWKNSVIVKLLGRRVGLKFLHLRLLKPWNPMGEMEQPGGEVSHVAPVNGEVPAQEAENGVIGGSRSGHGSVEKERTENNVVEDTYGPWMLVQRTIRHRQGSGVQNGKKDLKDTLPGGKKVADKNTAAGSRFAILENDEVNMGDGEDLSEQAPLTNLVSSTEKKQLVDRTQTPQGVMETTQPLTKITVDPPSQSNKPGPSLQPSPIPKTVTSIKRNAREQARVSPAQSESSSETQAFQSHQGTFIPIVQPLNIPQANMCVLPNSLGREPIP